MAKRFGDWEVVRDLMSGGQAWTYLVRSTRQGSGHVFVLKRLKNTANRTRVQRFQREIKVGWQLSHPNILKVLDYKLDDNHPFFVAEYCTGGTLADAELGGFSIVDKLRIFATICRAMGYAHSNGVIHRDLKPDNIFLKLEPLSPVIGDFGLCLMAGNEETRLTATPEAVGSRWYMAPELEDGRLEDAKPSADVYSLGKILYWLMAGRIFSREKHREPQYDLTKVITDSAVFLIYELLDASIVSNPASRQYKDGNELANAVENVRRRIQMSANPVGWNLPQLCRYCGVGNYKKLYSNFPGFNSETANDAFSVLGIELINPDVVYGKKWLFLVCDHCGNVQVFRADRSKEPKIWEERKG